MLQLASSPHPWSRTDAPSGTTELLFSEAVGEDPMQNLSAAVCSGGTLFLGSDEGAALERLIWDGTRWTGHSRIPLGELLDLTSEEEADIEGLAEDDGWLWVLGSHARTRPKIRRDQGDRIDAALFCNLQDTRPRCLLARLPLVRDANLSGALSVVAEDGVRRAGMLRQTKKGNALTKAMSKDPLIRPFTQIAAKEGGVDLEGIAVAGTRVALGMRGPVVRTYAVLLEMEIGAKGSGALKLMQPPRKRLLDLDGLGIRDLKRVRDDLLILAGPTTGLDGPCAVYRWPGWLHDGAEDDDTVCLHRPKRILDLPFGRGEEHPEGLALLKDGESHHLLVVSDGPSPSRIDTKRRALTCDLFSLPA